MAASRIDYLKIAVWALGFGVLAVVVRSGFREVASAVKAQARDCPDLKQRPADSRSTSSETTSPPPVVAPVPPPIPPEVLARDTELRRIEQAHVALQKQQEGYLSTCFKQPAGSEPIRSRHYEVTLRFDADGNEISRLFLAGYEQAERVACMNRQHLPKLKIPAPGQPITVQDRLLLP